jgi:arsenate reductase
MITIYHNPRCGKSRECLAYLEKSNKSFEIIKYLDNPISKKKIIEIITKLNIPAIELVRKKEKIWIEKYKEKKLTNEDVIHAIFENPIIMERPVVVNNDKAIIARPLNLIESIF